MAGMDGCSNLESRLAFLSPEAVLRGTRASSAPSRSSWPDLLSQRWRMQVASVAGTCDTQMPSLQRPCLPTKQQSRQPRIYLEIDSSVASWSILTTPLGTCASTACQGNLSLRQDPVPRAQPKACGSCSASCQPKPLLPAREGHGLLQQPQPALQDCNWWCSHVAWWGSRAAQDTIPPTHRLRLPARLERGGPPAEARPARTHSGNLLRPPQL